MQTIKTIVVVGLLLAVCYGAFIALNAPEVSIPEELEQWASSTNDKTLQDLEIPSLTFPEPFTPPSASPQFPLGKVDPTDSNPQFPTVDLSLPAAGASTLSATPSQPSGSTPPFPNSSASFPASGATLTSNASGANMASGSSDASGVQAASSPGPAFAGSSGQFPPFSSSFAESEAGPSIPFNANQPAQPAESTAIDDLISAGGEFGSFAAASNPTENPPAFPTAGSSTPNADGRSGDLGLLASRTVPEAQPGNDPNSTPSPESLMPFTTARTQALEMAQLGKLAEALEFLSPYYESPELGYTEHTDLVDILDALAREVIYSDRSLIYPKHTVSAQDTLEALAAKQRINVELLAAINKMGESQALLANTEIKLIEGPFRAQVSLSRGELTLFLRKLYAGRFPVSISQQNKPPLGNYEIVDRRKDRTFYGANSVIPAGAPTNPYGGYWLSLGGNLSIHGSPEQVTTDLEGAGCISLAPLDAADVYRILSKGASVEVRP